MRLLSATSLPHACVDPSFQCARMMSADSVVEEGWDSHYYCSIYQTTSLEYLLRRLHKRIRYSIVTQHLHTWAPVDLQTCR